MVSHPENGSDSPIGSDRDRGRDRFLGRNCVGDLLTFISFNFMSRPLGDVATSFAFHFFYSSCNLNSTLQLISFFPTIFQVTTSKWCRDLIFFCSPLL